MGRMRRVDWADRGGVAGLRGEIRVGIRCLARGRLGEPTSVTKAMIRIGAPQRSQRSGSSCILDTPSRPIPGRAFIDPAQSVRSGGLKLVCPP